MSFFPEFNNDITENAGIYAALGAMSHSRNQAQILRETREQKRLQEELIKKQEIANQAEQDRLIIEKNRLMIEQHKVEVGRLEKKEKELMLDRIKSIRQTLASINQNLDYIEGEYL